MRFSCDSCAAKFTIADEKVRGRIVAVKCSKCGAKITINGKSLVQPEPQHEEASEERTRVASLADLDALRANSGADAPAAAPAPAPARPAPAPAPVAARPQVSEGWYAIIDGQQLGPLSPQETLGHLKSGRLDARTYVWRDGQGDWLRADAVAELRALLAAPAPVAPPPFVAPTRSATPAPAASVAPAPAAVDPQADKTPPPDEPEEPPAAAQAASKPAALDRFLFEDELDSVPTQTGKPIDVASLVASDLDSSLGGGAPAADPFAAVPDAPSISKPGEIGEATRFFMKQAGVTRRNPPWKIALAVFLFVAVPCCVLYLLSQMRIVPLEITQIDEATGQEVKTSVFSSQGISGLRSMLLGNKPKAKARPKANGTRQVAVKGGSEDRPAAPTGDKGRRDGDDEPMVATIDGPGMSDAQRQLMQEAIAAHGGVGDGPKVRPELVDKVHVDGTPGLDEKVIAETVGKNLKAFQICTETELRRNPTFKGGKIKLTLTIGSSGIVTQSAIDKPDIERSDIGSCLKEKAKKIVFPKFQGEAFDVEVPLVLAAGA